MKNSHENEKRIEEILEGSCKKSIFKNYIYE